MLIRKSQLSSLCAAPNLILRSSSVAHTYHMRFDFLEVHISWISNFRGYWVFKFAVAGYSGVVIFAGEIFEDIWSESAFARLVGFIWRCHDVEWTATSEDFTSTTRYGCLVQLQPHFIPYSLCHWGRNKIWHDVALGYQVGRTDMFAGSKNKG